MISRGENSNAASRFHIVRLLIFIWSVNFCAHVYAGQQDYGIEKLQAGIDAYGDGRYLNAIINLEAALEVIPEANREDLWDTRLYMGLSYLLIGDAAETTEQFRKAQGIIKNKSPDVLVHSPKVVKLFKDTLKPKQVDAWKDPATGMEFVFVKGGCYEMGDNFGDGLFTEKPVHEVCIDNFYMGKYEVTQEQWEEIMSSNPSRFNNGSNYPVEKVSWSEVQEFVEKLNQKSGHNYRLPTEAEWEYAARSGGKSEKFAGTSKETTLDSYAWYRNNSDGKTHPVGGKKPNGLGLNDMTGNVWEWCQDRFSMAAYSEHQRNNPIYMKSGTFSKESRVIRGGSWNHSPMAVRASYRGGYKPDGRFSFLGFRLVRTVD